MTLNTSPARSPEPAPAAPERPDGSTRSAIWRSRWLWVAIALLVAGTALVFWARTSPGYDPYGWLVWGYQALRLHLDLGGAPSWKPMPFLFTLPYAVLGDLEFRLWTITAVSVALAGPVIAGHIVYRIVREDARRRWPAIVGALFAGAALLGIVPVHPLRAERTVRSDADHARARHDRPAPQPAATGWRSRACGSHRWGAPRRGRSLASTRSGGGFACPRCAR